MAASTVCECLRAEQETRTVKLQAHALQGLSHVTTRRRYWVQFYCEVDQPSCSAAQATSHTQLPETPRCPAGGACWARRQRGQLLRLPLRLGLCQAAQPGVLGSAGASHAGGLPGGGVCRGGAAGAAAAEAAQGTGARMVVAQWFSSLGCCSCMGGVALAIGEGFPQDQTS